MPNLKKLGKVLWVLEVLNEEQKEKEWDLSCFMLEDSSTGKYCSCVIGWAIRKGVLGEVELYPTGRWTYGIRRRGKVRVAVEEEILENLFDMDRDMVYHLFYPHTGGGNDVESARKRIEEFIEMHEVQ